MTIINKKLPLIAMSVLVSTLILTACGAEDTAQKTEAKTETQKGQDPLNKSVNQLKDKANTVITNSEKHNKQLEENTK